MYTILFTSRPHSDDSTGGGRRDGIAYVGHLHRHGSAHGHRARLEQGDASQVDLQGHHAPTGLLTSLEIDAIAPTPGRCASVSASFFYRAYEPFFVYKKSGIIKS